MDEFFFDLEQPVDIDPTQRLKGHCSRGYYRDMKSRKIKRKKNIAKRILHLPNYYEVDGQYSKGKIHCSCTMCTFSKKYHIPTYHERREKEKVKEAYADYYADAM